ncbi:unnamed protein product [Urochloa decumbens]|uniref:Pre-mRNA-processing factor 39 n=1 Tax=Urochloa decumbens TaxID=240449 RepID=A0ABC9BFK0_9POAL
MESEPEAAAAAVAVEPDAAAPKHHPSKLDVFQNRVRLLCDRNMVDFDAWVSLISAAEGTSADDIEVISLVYSSFLLEFPLCYGYWIKYAAHKARLCMNRDVVDVYEQAVQAVPHSVDLWVSYCGFGMCAYEEPADIRSLFERALSLVEKDYLCYHLWDKYIEFESSQKQLIQLGTIYINTLKFPTKKLHMYYESFRKFVTLLEQEVTSCAAGILSEKIHTSEMINAEDSELDTSAIIADLFDQKGEHLSPEALKHYLSAGERLYKRSSKIYKEICCFEASIKRPFFHVKPLDDDQLENWHQYLDFVEKNGDFDWAVKLYERCLIPCANYSEFWIRYSEYVDARGGREIANHALVRASSCFVKGVPTFCMYYALFKEQIGDASAARSLFVKASSNFSSGFYANINRLANMEKRMGNTEAASEIYETAIENAMRKQNLELLLDLYSNFAQFIYAASRSIVEAKEIFVKGINRVPCKPLIKGLIQFMITHGGPTEIPLLDSVISNAVTPGSDVSTALSPEDREDISLLFLEFVDLYGDVKELRKAWARHSKLFPHSTGNMSQRYSTTGNRVQESNKRRKTEPSIVAHDDSLEDTRKLKQPSITDNFSLIFDKEAESLVERGIVDSGRRYRDAGEHKALENLDSHKETSRISQECTDMVHSQHNLDKHGMQNQTNSYDKEETNQDLSLHEQNDEKTSDELLGEKARVAESGNCDSPSKAIANSNGEMVCSKSDLPSGSSMPKEGSSSDPAGISAELEERQPVEVQVKLDTEPGLSVGNANLERSNDSPNTTDCDKVNTALGHESQDHVQSSQPQQSSVCAKASSSELANTKADTLGFQVQLQHQVANSQTHQSSNISLSVQNIQQQELSYTMPQNVQTSAQTQDQLSAQSNQGNQQYLQMTQGYASQMWQYYQQQLYYLQAQHSQQMQNLQQQQLPTEHLQQNFMQQVQQLNQQMVLWQQQVQQQQQQVVLQQALPVQQLPDKKQGQHPSSGDTNHDQSKQQQQAPPMDQQSQQLQQQQLLYFQQQQQQQQQQQMYLMQQQQQVYQQQQAQQQQLFQQQLMQQQQFVLQMPQLQQDSVQQQQQLFQQQQQQMMLLQQQFMQQQMQQYLQQQQNQQGPKDQYMSNPQDVRNKQMEHGQQSEASQSDGSKLRSGEQSELSYPSTPQSQRSNR